MNHAIHPGSRVAFASRADVATIGVTDYAQSQLGDVRVRRTAEGRPLLKEGGSRSRGRIRQGPPPTSTRRFQATCSKSNEALATEPALVNSDAGGKAWFFKMKIADKSELDGLMDEAAYKKHTA